MEQGEQSEDDTPPDQRLMLRLDGFEGPIDLLLTLARDQKVDLTRISILALAEQYLTFIQEARTLKLEVAAEYIVMAAWLAYLKSRLLLPASVEQEEEPSGEEMAAALRFQLQRLEAMREAAAQLMARTRLGVEVLPRGMPETLEPTERHLHQAKLYDLLAAYGTIRRRTRPQPLRIEASVAWSIERAMGRLRELLGGVADWAPLEELLPELEPAASPLEQRSALAATFGASLELAKAGQLYLRQDGQFAAIYLRPRGPRLVVANRGGEA